MYRHYLELPQFAQIAETQIPNLTLGQPEDVRDCIRKQYSPSTAYRAVQQGKEMLEWAWKFRAGKSGLEDEKYEWWRRWSVDYKCRERTHVPSIPDLVRTLALVELLNAGAAPCHEVSPGTLAALWGVVLTAQRTGALVRLRSVNLLDHADFPGWKIAHWTAADMKGGRDGGRPHSLPLPPEAVAVLSQYWDEKGEWVFRSGKVRGHVTKSALNRMLDRLQGQTMPDKRRPKPQRRGKPGPKLKGSSKVRPNLFEQYGIEAGRSRIISMNTGWAVRHPQLRLEFVGDA